MRIVPLLSLLIFVFILTIEIVSQPALDGGRTEQKEYAIKLLEKLKEESLQGKTTITGEGENHITVNYCGIRPSKDGLTNEDCERNGSRTRTNDDVQSKELAAAPSIASLRSASSHTSIPQHGIFPSENRLLKRMVNWFSGSGGSRKDGDGGSRRDKGKGVARYITTKELEKKLRENPAPADTLETCTQRAIDAISTELTKKERGFKDIKYDNRDEWDFINEQMKKFLREKFGAHGFFLETDEHGIRKEGNLRIYPHAATVKRTTFFRTWYGTQEQIDQGLMYFARAHASSSNQPSYGPAPAGRGRSRPSHGPEPAARVGNLPSHAPEPTEHGRIRTHRAPQSAEHNSNQPSHAPAPAGRGRSRPSHGPEPAGHVSNLPTSALISGDITETDVNIGRLMRFEGMIGPR